jgi:peptidoglycan/xylan/chitin deacetylase (PgdA/CDA1 family)
MRPIINFKSSVGTFVISLDFELYWGVHGSVPLTRYRQNLEGEHLAVPEILKVFSENQIHATWATVGFLYCTHVEDLKLHFPERKPEYRNAKLSPYPYIESAKRLEPIHHFAPGLIEQIRRTAGQEIGTHTCCHYYCLEEGQTVDDFEADLIAALAIARGQGDVIRSLVFPRNQSNPKYLHVVAKYGIRCVRGNESHWIYEASDAQSQNPLRRAIRLLDAYANLTGHNTHRIPRAESGLPYDFPASRFLRPYSPHLAWADRLRLRRITRAMTHAAQHGQIFHLWWHPHNFGIHTKRNLAFLAQILAHYRILSAKYGMTSLNMGELCDLADSTHRSAS